MKKISQSILLIILTFLLLQNVRQVFAQQVSRPDRGLGAIAPFSSSDVENINLQNGNVGLSIPLASLPSIAGGKLSYTIHANYNSKLWDTYMSQSFTGPGEGSEFYPMTNPRVSDFGGWRVGGKYTLYGDSANDDYVRHSGYYDADTQLLINYQWAKFYFVTPDGSKHEIKPFGYQPFWGSNTATYGSYFKDSPYSTGVPMRYYTVDGSYIWLTVYPPNYPLVWEANLPDGTKIQQSSDYVQRIIDQNGNKIKIFDDSLGTHYQDEQTDREIRVTLNTQTGRTEVWYQTVGGVWQKVEVVNGTTTVQGKFQANETPTVPYQNGCILHTEFRADLNVIREIIFPQTEAGQTPPKYTFSYNSDETDPNGVMYTPGCGSPDQNYPNPSKGAGELSQMTTPTGAIHKYSYVMDNTHLTNDFGLDWSAAANLITQKAVHHDGIIDTWNYSIGGLDTNVTNPDGSSRYMQMYSYSPAFPSTYGGSEGFGGLVYRETVSNKIRTERRWARQVFTGAHEFVNGGRIVFNPVVTQEYTTLLDDGGNAVKMSAKTFQYDYNGNVKETKEYDWFDPNSVSRDATGVPLGVPVGATLLRTTTVSYHNSPPNSASPLVYAKTSNSILNAVSETSVGVSTTRFSYDNQSFGSIPIKGNITQVSVWDNINNQWINLLASYDIYGNIISTTDPKSNLTQIFYEDATHAMPTKTIVDPNNGTGQQIATTVYDFSTGLPTSSTDINGNVSSVSYINNLLGAVDPFGRPGTIFSPYINIDGVNKRQTVKTYYEDNSRKTRVETDLFNEGDALLKARETRDQLGRTVLTERNENGANVYTISSQMVYKPQQRVVLSSNPTRNDNAPTDGWTRATTDILGRTTEVATFSGAAQPPISGTNANWTGSVTSSYLANTTTVTDQAGKKRRSAVNALGQLIRVDEPNDAGQLDVNNVPVQPTNYSYDVLGNLTQVQQIGTTTQQCGGTTSNCTQTRTFAYDSLSRLLTATNPEAGTINYVYDLNGNLTQKIDARGVITNYVYDALNRITNRNYIAPANLENYQATLPVSYNYDNLPNAKGRLTKVTTGTSPNEFSETRYLAFDVLGRVTSSQQKTDGVTYNPMTYVYNLSGALIEETYPSGRVVRNTLDQDGSLQQVQSRKANDTFKNYANSFNYTAAGAVSSMRLGNGRWENMQFNSRLQPTQIGLGTSATNQSLLKLDYEYGELQGNGSVDTLKNNGNIAKQTITVPNVGGNQGFTAVQSYSYDSLNRLEQADEKPLAYTQVQCDQNPTYCWKQTFTYDRYGNRRFDQSNTTFPTFENPNITNPQIDPTNNRFTTGQGYTYDLSGNLLTDAEGRTFTYDAENKQKSAATTSSTLGQYFYDGDGKRVKKLVPSTGETTIFIYDAGGKMVAEYSTIVAPQSEAKISYLTSDHLGSPRIITNELGQPTSRRDFMPFGEEIQRASYGADTVRQKFTGYERDIETELDFAQARYYNKNHGRFTSPDEPFADQYEDNPQSWNLYLYTRNNPLNLIDPLGTKADCPNGPCPDVCPDGKVCGHDKDGKIISVEDDTEPVVIEATTKRPWYEVVADVVLSIFRMGGCKVKTPKKTTLQQPQIQPQVQPQPVVPVRPSPVLQFTQQQLQKKFEKHAKDFRVQGNYNANTAQQFQQAIQNHVNNAVAINGTYRGQQVIHYYNPQTGLNVITDRAGNFISGWKLNPIQAQNVIIRGSL